MALQIRARQLSAEANDISENWGAGGTYRQITTALIGAAGGNISAGNAAFVQGLVVNYVQQRGAGYIGDLVADGELTEGSPLHAALHGIVACAGAAASSQSCGSGAAGAAASSLLTGLFSQSSPDESEEQREAKRNLIVSLVTGLAATSASIDPTAANTAAGAAVDNNWLATQQIVQYKKELDEAKGTEVFTVFAKWAFISSKQDVLTQFGIGKGLAKSGWNDVEGLAQFVTNPIEGLKGLKELIANPEVQKQFKAEFLADANKKIDTITNALEVGGSQNAEDLGVALGEIAWQVGSIVTGVGGVAKGGVALAKAGIKVGTAELETMAGLARMEKLAKAEAVRNRVVGAIADSKEASASSKFGQLAKTEAELRDAQRVKSATEIPIVKVKTENAVKGTPEYELLNNPSARAANTRYELDNGKSFTTNGAGQVEELTFTPVNEKSLATLGKQKWAIRAETLMWVVMLRLAAKAEHVTATTFSHKIKISIIQPIKFSMKISSKRLWTTRRRQLAQPQ